MASELRALCLSRNTTIEMVKDRGYTTTQEVQPLESFREKYPFALTKRSSLNFVCVDVDRPVAIHFGDDEKMGKKSFEGLLSQYEKDNIFHLILILPQMPSPAVMSMIALNAKFNVEIFLVEEMMFNKTKHSWVPPHRILSREERENVFKSLKLGPGDLPRILRSDVIARYYGARQGDVVEIVRRSRTAGESIYYRIVVER
ncbi:DNA-directed RNA polymerase subunit Rpb5 [Encephalitozoon hellem ATCC 50504]|uniref:DNA-directed RNA polymerases I, II, and III subunit RPABC1 n=1 Tax=Encephalitozoon hellem TaxID=27973 RepID=A0A9Q9C8R4_ENCHE|nr:DNA-directed RNA polymerase subunit Rpb5 [Encephalitozoon hellem ATCC 50504]AFM98620.1 DNA-directed RNA polymerase subunit Rpb5 [Encephalitozoon hellem ATCC 50504]UTX43565.1 DNA-directed RNA polymerases I, II, and III subunit RPABC1 [Encephalitozoon hellem]|eukprot:XP_003887601.1 DNA-directed RNA polymerase subunit Rpb5 [Encephalitozoon hellem ATCC 50504]